MVVQLYKFTKTCLTVSLKWVNFMNINYTLIKPFKKKSFLGAEFKIEDHF